MSDSPLRLRRFLRHGTMPQLAAFEAVLRLGSVTRAADTLCMAQPTVSGHLRKLSDSLGITLFEPQGRQLVPTPAALALRTAVGEVFDSLDRVASELDALRPPPLLGAATSLARLPATAAMA